MKIFNRSLLLVLTLLALTLLIPQTDTPASAAETVESGTCGKNLTWTLDEDGVLTISGMGAMSGYNPFYGNAAPWQDRNYTKVVICDGVTDISSYAFYQAKSLVSAEIADTVKNIGYCAFYRSETLSSVKLSGTLSYISDMAFMDCTSLTSVTLPKTLNGMGDSVFSNCTALNSVKIENGVTALGNRAFAGCESLTSVYFPESLTSLGYSVFSGCSGLEKYMVAADNPAFASMDGALYTKNFTEFLYCPGGKTDALSIADGVTFIDGASFDSPGPSSITIPKTVSSMSSTPFRSCHNLKEIIVDEGNAFYLSDNDILYDKIKMSVICCPQAKAGSVTLPKGTTALSDSAFSGCTELKSVSLPDTVTTIGHEAFSGCTSLESFVIPYGVKSIWKDTFEECTSLRAVIIPETVTNICTTAFRKCAALKSVIIPKSVTSILNGAFEDAGLETVLFQGDAPEISVYDYPFENVTATVYYPEGNKTWTESVMTEAGKKGNLTWKTYAPGSDPTASAPKITTQPKTQYVQLGEKAKFTVKAKGEDLTYQWYYKDVDGKKYKKCSGTKATYSLEMTEARKDRKLYCVITDKNGNEVKSKTVYMRMAASIKTQPKTQYVQLGEKAKFTVKAVGDDLTYQWYYKSAGSSKYKKASCTKATYTITQTEARRDRKFYCIITDEYGNEVKSKTVTMKMAASIKTEPKSVKTSIGKKAKFTVKAVGDDLKYQWYYKDVNGKKYKKASGTKATYSIELTKARNGRKFYCVVTDKYGNTVKSKTVSMKKK